MGILSSKYSKYILDSSTLLFKKFMLFISVEFTISRLQYGALDFGNPPLWTSW